MSDFTSTVNSINQLAAANMPAVVAAVQAVESMAPEGTIGAQKAVVAVQAITQTLAGSPNANVAGVASLVNMAVLIANLLGAFRHKSSASAKLTS